MGISSAMSLTDESSGKCKKCLHHCGRTIVMKDKETQTSDKLDGERSRKSSNYGSHPGQCLTVICNCNHMDTHTDTRNECICHRADIVRHPNRPNYSNHQLDRSFSMQSSEPYDCNIHGFREWRNSRDEGRMSRKRKSSFDDDDDDDDDGVNIEAKKAREEIVEILRKESQLKADILEIPRRSSVKLETKLTVMERYKDELRSRVRKR